MLSSADAVSWTEEPMTTQAVTYRISLILAISKMIFTCLSIFDISTCAVSRLGDTDLWNVISFLLTYFHQSCSFLLISWTFICKCLTMSKSENIFFGQVKMSKYTFFLIFINIFALELHCKKNTPLIEIKIRKKKSIFKWIITAETPFLSLGALRMP